MVIHSSRLFSKINTLCYPSKIWHWHCFSISLILGRKANCQIRSFVIDLSSFNQGCILFWMRPIQVLIVHWWTECVLFSMYCQVLCLSTSTVFNKVLRYVWIERVNVTNLRFDCRLLNTECVIFSHTVSGKDWSKTFLTLIWILIERPYKWRNQFQVDSTVFKARNLRTFHCLRCSED